MTLTYGVLSQVNPGFNESRQRELETLYVGGYAATDNADSFMPKLVGETKARWSERINSAAFVPYMGQIVDYYTSSLFKQPIAVTPSEESEQAAFEADFYEAFQSNVDLTGSSLVEFMRSVFTTALVHKRGLVAIDFPKVDAPAVARIDEDASGAARAYLLQLDPCELIDWDYDSQVRKRLQIPGNGVVEFDVGKFKWCVLRRKSIPREGIASTRGKVVEEFKVWQRDPDSGAVTWVLFRATYSPDKPPRPDDLVELIDTGTTSFEEIPIVELCIPNGLWIGNKVGPLNKEHWQRRSILNASENRGLVTIPYVKLGPEMGPGGGEMPAEVQQDGGRGDSLKQQLAEKGYMVIGADDDVGFAEPTGAMNDSTESRIGKLADEIFRVAHMMAASVSSTASHVGRSGASKSEDRYATTIILYAYGAIVRDFARRIYDCVSAGRKEPVCWAVHGLDKFDLYDRPELLAEALDVDSVKIPSATFKTVYKTELASRLMPHLPPETISTIAEEIEKGVETEQERAEAAAEAQAEAPIPINPPGQSLPRQAPKAGAAKAPMQAADKSTQTPSKGKGKGK